MEGKHTPEQVEKVVSKVIDSFWRVMQDIFPSIAEHNPMVYFLEGHCVSLVEILCNVFGETDDVKIYKHKDLEHYATWINGHVYDAYGDREKAMHDADDFEFYRDLDELEFVVIGSGRRHEDPVDAAYTDRMIEVCKEMLKGREKEEVVKRRAR